MQNADLNEHKLSILDVNRKFVALTVEIPDSQLGSRPYIEFPPSFEGRLVNLDAEELYALRQRCPIKAALEGRSYSVLEVKTDGFFNAIKDGDWQ